MLARDFLACPSARGTPCVFGAGPRQRGRAFHALGQTLSRAVQHSIRAVCPVKRLVERYQGLQQAGLVGGPGHGSRLAGGGQGVVDLEIVLPHSPGAGRAGQAGDRLTRR